MAECNKFTTLLNYNLHICILQNCAQDCTGSIWEDLLLGKDAQQTPRCGTTDLDNSSRHPIYYIVTNFNTFVYKHSEKPVNVK